MFATSPRKTDLYFKYCQDSRDLGSNLLRLFFHFKSCGLWTLSCDSVPHNHETLKWFSSLPTLMQKSFWWWQCSDRYIISLSPHLHTLFPPFSPSLISRTVSVDVKHHGYFQCKLLRYMCRRIIACINSCARVKNSNTGSHTIVWTQENTAHTGRNG